MSEENKAVVVKFIEAFSDGDAETAKACLAPGAMTIAKGFGKLSGLPSKLTNTPFGRGLLKGARKLP